MEHLFLNHQSDLVAVSESVFKSLGINQFLEGDSQNVLSGVYYTHSVFGMLIKIELNSYDYEEKYRFMISIKKDLTQSLEMDTQMEDWFVRLILKLLSKNSDLQFSIEKDDALIDISELV